MHTAQYITLHVISQQTSIHNTTLHTKHGTAHSRTSFHTTHPTAVQYNTAHYIPSHHNTICTQHSTSLSMLCLSKPQYTIPHCIQSTVQHIREHRITQHIPLQYKAIQNTTSHLTITQYPHSTVHHSPCNFSANLTAQTIIADENGASHNISENIVSHNR